jgi:hypothetical protein
VGVFNWWLSVQPHAHTSSSLADVFTLKTEAIRSSETSVHTRSTWHRIPEDSILQLPFSVQNFQPSRTHTSVSVIVVETTVDTYIFSLKIITQP